jgi:putative hydrolase of the HAD superfamily
VPLPDAVAQKSAELGITLADQNDLLREWQGVFLFRQGTIRLIRSMKQRGWQTAIASNQDGRRAQTLRQILFLDDVVDVWGFSAEMGLAKPDPAFYRAIHAMAKVPATLPCVMIDDKPDNLEAPAAMGWYTHLYQTEAGLEAFLATLP